MMKHLRAAGLYWVAGAVMAAAMSGCAAGPGSGAPTGTAAPPSPATAGYHGITSGTVETVRMSIQIGPTPRVWVLDLQAAQAYVIAPIMDPSSTATSSTGPSRPLTATQIANFRAALDAAGVWTWADWANKNRGYGPAGNATVEFTGAGRTVTIDLGLPSACSTDGSCRIMPGWDTFRDAVIALAGE